ncbi:T9SS type A sorting domain-containing protein, partial [Bacteroidota bacterium]
FENKSEKIKSISLINAIGQTIFNQEEVNKPEFLLDTKYIQKGVYFLKINLTNDTCFYSRIIKH